MVRNLFIIIGFIVTAFQLNAQNLTIEISQDTVKLDSQFEITYIIDRSCRPENLLFEDFDIVSGPNISKSMSYMNGNLSSETKLSYTLKAREEGTFNLPNELCDVKSKVEPILVVSNDISSIKGKKKVRKKRLIKKI